jgi:effector-binding domain-containing protein
MNGITPIKKWLIVLGLFVLGGITVSLLKDKSYSITTEIDIAAPPHVVFNAINNLSYQKDWNAKSALDTSFKLLCVGNPVGTNASCDFKSKMYGDGIIRIVHSEKSDSINLAEEANNGRILHMEYNLSSSDDKITKIYLLASSQSGFITNLWNFIHIWKLKKHMGHQMDNLKVFINERYHQKIYHGYKIEEIVTNQRFFIGHRAEVNFENITQYYAQNIAALYQTALKNQMVAAGMPCGLYFSWDAQNQKTDMAAALPTLAENHVQGTQVFNLPSGRALKLIYKGEGSKSAVAHEAMDAYMLDHLLQQSAPIIEEYMTDPTQEPNPENWITNIYYYVNEKKI